LVDANLNGAEGKSGPFFLAPMAGITDSAFRLVCRELGSSRSYTEMVSAKGLFYGGKGSFDLLKHSPDEGPVFFQLFGSDPGIMADAVTQIEKRAESIEDDNRIYGEADAGLHAAVDKGAAVFRKKAAMGAVTNTCDDKEKEAAEAEERLYTGVDVSVNGMRRSESAEPEERLNAGVRAGAYDKRNSGASTWAATENYDDRKSGAAESEERFNSECGAEADKLGEEEKTGAKLDPDIEVQNVNCAEVDNGDGKKNGAAELEDRLNAYCGAGADKLGEEKNIGAKLDPIGFDINMGCPVPKVVNNGEGSALMKNPDLAGRIIEAMAKRTKRPITVKMRIGWDAETINAVEFAKVVVGAGAAAVCVHGRTRDQYYSGKADWQTIADVKTAVTDGAFVYGSGDVFSAEDAVRMMDETGCDAVMVARGALGNPWIFKQANLLYAGASSEEVQATAPDLRARADMFLRHASLTLEDKGEYVAIREMRKHAGWYFKSMPRVTSLRESVNRIESMDSLIKEIEEYCAASRF